MTTHISASTLPRQLTAFVGRSRELAKIHDLLLNPDCRLLTLVGVGGIGKTQLALEAATTMPVAGDDSGDWSSYIGKEYWRGYGLATYLTPAIPAKRRLASRGLFQMRVLLKNQLRSHLFFICKVNDGVQAWH